ncbi:MAG: hypothetical protein IKE28_06310 [Solobacterium sp.]|nr:hypothetical protein [Solobacterium sp.]
MEDNKKIENEDLEQVGGGRYVRPPRHHLYQEIETMIPEEVRLKLRGAESVADSKRILAENGLNVNMIEQKIEAANLAPKTVGLAAMPDDALENIAGGFDFYGSEIKCSCGNNNPGEFMVYPPFYLPDYKCYLRCDRCRRYIFIRNDGEVFFDQPV